MICPTDEALAALSAGELAADERALIEDHAATCSACRGLVSAIAGVHTQRRGTGIGAEGATIGRYLVRGAAGHGAMGVVLRAHDPVLDREVAIKMVRSFTDGDGPVRMLDEAQTLARVDHPNVVRVYDAGVVGEEVFVAMAFVDGPTLAQWKSADIRARVKVLASVGRGICAVHEVGLVHRDIKPDNIIVSDDEGVLVDLGLAKALRGGVGSGRAGTEHYIAPEIRAGKGASPASDQYAWCRVAQETLADVERPALARVLARGLADDPAKRFPTLGDAIHALERAFAPRRSRWFLVAAVAATVGVAVYALGVPQPGDPCDHDPPLEWRIDRPLIRAHVAAAHGDAELVDRKLDARARSFANLTLKACWDEKSDRTQAMRETLCLEETWRHSTRIFEGLVHPNPRYVRDAIDELTFVLPLERCASGVVPAVPAQPAPADRDKARAIAEELRAIKLGHTSPAAKLAAVQALAPRVTDPATLEDLHMELADLDHKVGKISDANKELDIVVHLAELHGDDDTRTRALIDILRNAFNAGDGDTAKKAIAAEDAAARLGNPAITAELDISEGLAFATRGDVKRALVKLHDALDLLENVAIGPNAELINVLQNLGGMQQANGDLAAAGKTYDRGYALALARYGELDVSTLEIRGARASNLLYLKLLVPARAELVAVADGLKKLVGDAPPVVQARGYVCEADLSIDEHAAAPSCDALLALAEKVFPPTDPQLAWPLTLSARAHLGPDAIAPLERALAITASNQIAPTDHAAAAAWLAMTLHELHRDPVRAAKLAAEARPGLASAPELLAQLDKLFGRVGKNQ